MGQVPLTPGLLSGKLSEEDQASVDRYRRILNRAVETAIITLDEKGIVTGWSDGATSLLGWTEQEMLGESLGRIFPEEAGGADAFLAEIAEASVKGTAGAEGWRMRKDGQRIWAIGETSVLYEGDPSAGFVKILRDRTERRQVELALVEQTRALELLNQAGAALAREGDLDKLVQTVTDVGVALSGAEFGAFFYNVVNQEGQSYMLYTLSGVPREAFSKFPMPRNTAVFAPTFLGQGIVRSEDITLDPRYGQNAPHEGMPEGHLPVRSYLAVPVVSRSGEVLGGLFFGHSKPGVFTAGSERNLAGLAGEAAVAIDNVRLMEAMQREVEERRRAETALRDLNSHLEEQVRLRTEELIQHADALRQAQKVEALGQLTGGIAHDFNNILQVIVGSMEVLTRTLPEHLVVQRRATSAAVLAAKRAAASTQRLLAFARRQPLDPKPVDINEMVLRTSELLKQSLGETIETCIVLSEDVWTVEADPNELQSALVNLAVNARDAMPGGGKLTVETANTWLDDAYAARHAEITAGEYAQICMTDSGTGMDAQTLARAFEPFFTTKPVDKGTGLGLSQVYGFVKQSRGHVKIYSELGVGTTVKIYLPRHHEKEPLGEMQERRAPAPASGESILLVEDDPDVRAYAAGVLRELGYRVVEAVDGPSAVERLKNDRVDLVFTDVVLPGGMTGADIVAYAQQRWPSVKALFTTGYARNAIVHNGRLDKGVQLISKPFSFDDLAAKLREVLELERR
ncbi:response regulator [Roseateles sp.]|uniref:response regulator n=1 Tax=Roseateles sp. TaxID=1971397 RepID=UPI0031E1B084